MPELSKVAAVIRPGVFAALEAAVKARRSRGGALVPLHLGDTHRAPPSAARFENVLAGRSDAALYAYGATGGLEELRAAVAARARELERATPGATEANVLVGAGATNALASAARAVLDPGDDVLVCSPYWPLAHGIFSSCGARVVEVPFSSRAWAEPSFDAGAVLSAGVTPRTRLLYFITPNNPDGKVLTRADLERVAAFSVAHDLWVIADEVYADYAYDGRAHVSIARLPGMAERTITAYSFSKSHALAGVRVGVVIAPERVIAASRRVGVHAVFNVPVLCQASALASLGATEWVEEARAEYRAARDLSASALAAAGVAFHEAEGGVYHFCDFSRVLGGRPLEVLLERAIERGVMLAPGRAFGAAYDRCARLCFTSVPRDALERGLDALALALRDVA